MSSLIRRVYCRRPRWTWGRDFGGIRIWIQGALWYSFKGFLRFGMIPATSRICCYRCSDSRGGLKSHRAKIWANNLREYYWSLESFKIAGKIIKISLKISEISQSPSWGCRGCSAGVFPLKKHLRTLDAFLVYQKFKQRTMEIVRKKKTRTEKWSRLV